MNTKKSPIYLDDQAKLNIKQFVPLLKQLSPNSNLKLKPITLKGKDYSVTLNLTLSSDNDNNPALHLSWSYNDKEYSQVIPIIRNTITNPLTTVHRFYFKTYGKQKQDKQARYLYHYEGEFKHTDLFSHRINNTKDIPHKMMRLKKGNPEHRCGKRFHNGKLTTYGRRCLRYELAQLEVLQKMYGELTRAQEDSIKDMRKMLGMVEKKKK
jgi:hypothetical protein